VALITIIPMTPAWRADRQSEDAAGLGADYHAQSVPEKYNDILWFKQTIPDACGSIAMLHSALNGACASDIIPGSILEHLRDAARPLAMEERAQMLYDSDEFEEAHQSVASMGDTEAPEIGDPRGLGRHFVAFVKANGRLWELEGNRLGPIDRGELADDEDVLSPRALELGLGRVIKLEQTAGGGDVNFSCVAVVKE
jgi:ubiquitin carboxyl-terminal hydrolase L3